MLQKGTWSCPRAGLVIIHGFQNLWWKSTPGTNEFPQGGFQDAYLWQKWHGQRGKSKTDSSAYRVACQICTSLDRVLWHLVIWQNAFGFIGLEGLNELCLPQQRRQMLVMVRIFVRNLQKRKKENDKPDEKPVSQYPTAAANAGSKPLLFCKRN
ncbi:uncharacterized protein TM35_000251540 [Trypanosoma theileri]|uniref:Uncharacterized protein n=1 Tax=Trypanosoma theileri TaxID=67003 RepID=A0A1X0NQQ6_9TRYP|nr:uncharacterized protein TM35_000251540 [Trypanosoma theileri]ORC86858.1 hypothetical protein TM35_000251540 [Trypanosoma theileri]